jgi:hypothetical protein
MTEQMPGESDHALTLTATQLADRLQTNKRTLRAMVARGDFLRPSFRIGLSPRWTKSVVDRWLEASPSEQAEMLERQAQGVRDAS